MRREASRLYISERGDETRGIASLQRAETRSVETSHYRKLIGGKVSTLCALPIFNDNDRMRGFI
ncbi:MAG: hypothetical protein VSS75_002990 [Candidatus Parabeggiatoa sp.]|nr:hypothetical protein [Candidatus Parabeggiatoa sp.]